MHQTISGETHKTKVEFDYNTKEFFKKEKELFHKLSSLKNGSIYENTKIVENYILNYLNIIDNNNLDSELKKIIRSEFTNCEKIYPFMGDLLLDIFFKKKKINRYSTLKFRKNLEKNFINSLKNNHVKQIAELIFNHISLEYLIDVKKEKTDQVIIVKKDDLCFDIDFDFDYFFKRATVIDDYNVVIIDGIIDTVGDIHHLLHQASENKENYVIFCYGVSPEVKHTILNNNKRGITKVFPIDIKVCEYSLNILNDIAIIHGDDVISALKGQTISQAVSKKLKKGKRIKIKKNNIIIEKVCLESDYVIHKKFLNKRILESTNETNRKYLRKRFKRLNTKTIEIIIPESLNYQNSFSRELDYLIRFITNLDKKFIKIKNVNNKSYYYIPEVYFNFCKLKSDKMNDIFENIKTIITNNEKSNGN